MIGRMLDARMKELGYNQTSLAAASKKRLSQGYISALIRGEIGMPGPDKIMAFEELLGLSKEDFYIADGKLEKVDASSIYDSAPLGELVKALHLLPGVKPQLEALASQTPRLRERVIRSLARKWAVDLEEALSLIEDTQLELPIDPNEPD